MFSTLSAFEFQQKFTDRNECLQYLAELKWKDGYVCKKCGCKSFTKGYHPFARRCAGCRYDESASAHTVFHNLKFSLQKAFTPFSDIVRRKVSLPTNWQRKLVLASQQHGYSIVRFNKHLNQVVKIP